MDNIYLCGFMGCGKSSAGKILAQKLGYDFEDTDTLIEKKLGQSIPDIFAEKGEDYFRDIEHEMCKQASLFDKTVVAMGGGALCFERNAAALKNSGRIIFIDVPLEIIVNRLKGDKSRPLFSEDNFERLECLYTSRHPIYKKNSHITVDGTGDTHEAVNKILLIKDECK